MLFPYALKSWEGQGGEFAGTEGWSWNLKSSAVALFLLWGRTKYSSLALADVYLNYPFSAFSEEDYILINLCQFQCSTTV